MFTKQNCSLLLCSDIKINLLNYDNHMEVSFLLINCLLCHCFPRSTSPNILPVIAILSLTIFFTNVLHDEMCCGILIDDTSDHLPVLCITNHEVKTKQNFFIERRIMNAYECIIII